MITDHNELNDKIDRIAKVSFGIPRLHNYQKKIIQNIYEACICRDSEKPRETLTILPTGAGKSLCYMIPCLLLPGYTLVIYPLNALIADQYNRFRNAGVSTAVIRGGMSRQERRTVLQQECKAILTNPESLLLEDIQQMLREKPPDHLVIDEAHTFAEWGKTFRPACLDAAELIQNTDFLHMSAFTATATPELLQEIAAILFPSGSYGLFSKIPAKENISYSLRTSVSKSADLHSLIINQNIPRPVIIFCSTRNETEETARMLCRYVESDLVRFYHAGLSRQEKQTVEAWFMSGGEKILTATCAFGLGIDAKSIKTVIHRSAPATVEAYIQESGRAGRDGSLCRSVLLLGPEDKLAAAASENIRRNQFLHALSRNNVCRRVSLMKLFAPESAHPSCGICDVCRNEVSLTPPGIPELLNLVNAFNGSLLPGEAAEYMKSYRQSPGGYATQSAHSFFKSWEYEWCQEIIESALVYGYLKKSPAFRRYNRRLCIRTKGKLLLQANGQLH